MVNTKFLSLQIENHINWKNHIEQMVPELHGAYYAIRSIVHISNINNLKSIYCAYFHSVIKYGITFWQPFQWWEDFHFTKENLQNYGWCTTQYFI